MNESDLIYEYFYHNIISPYNELQKKRKNIPFGENKYKNACINLCTQLYHFKEKLETKHPSKFPIKCLITRCSDFGYIHDITNISKHHEWDYSRNPNPLISSEQDISEVLEFIDLKDDLGVYSVARIVVRIATSQGKFLYITDLLATVINMWLDILEDLGYINNPVKFELLTFDPPDRSEKNKYHDGNISVTAGLAWNFAFSFLRYDYSTNELLPK